MTTRQALQEAKRRWGPQARVQSRKACVLTETRTGRWHCWDHRKDCRGGRPVRKVGKIELGLFFLVRGSGETWEEAFKAADEADPAVRRLQSKDA